MVKQLMMQLSYKYDCQEEIRANATAKAPFLVISDELVDGQRRRRPRPTG